MGQSQSMEIVEIPNKKINTRTPLRTGNIPQLIEEIRPLSNYHIFRDYGSIKFLSKSPIIDYIGLFSFVLYYRSMRNYFFESKYYIGLQIYAEIIHTNDFFINYGMVIYTDENTFDILKESFSIYDKVIIAVVNWPKFTIDDKIENTVLRCLRFHALEAFPNSDIFIRDSDTIFPTEIFSSNHAYQMGVKGINSNGHPIEDYRTVMIDKIGDWEKTFIEKINEPGTPSIIIGTNLLYLSDWHREIPFQIKHRGIEKYLYEPLFCFKAPSGVFAGFINFKRNRPSDLWTYSIDYIHNQFEIKDGEINNVKLNYGKRVVSIGKDEKIILFIIIVKYWSLCFFFTIYYTDDIEYYSNNNIKTKTNKPAVNTYDNCNINMNSHVVLDLGVVSYRKTNRYSNILENHIKVWTKILDPSFISLSYNKIINNKLIKSWRQPRMLCGKIINSNSGKTFNNFYKEIFRKFSQEYLEWLNKIRITPIENIKLELTKFYNKNNNIRKLLNNSNYIKSSIESIKFIYNSKLPPIEFSESPIPLSIAKDANAKKKANKPPQPPPPSGPSPRNLKRHMENQEKESFKRHMENQKKESAKKRPMMKPISMLKNLSVESLELARVAESTQGQDNHSQTVESATKNPIKKINNNRLNRYKKFRAEQNKKFKNAKSKFNKLPTRFLKAQYIATVGNEIIRKKLSEVLNPST